MRKLGWLGTVGALLSLGVSFYFGNENSKLSSSERSLKQELGSVRKELVVSRANLEIARINSEYFVKRLDTHTYPDTYIEEIMKLNPDLVLPKAGVDNQNPFGMEYKDISF